MSTLGVLGVFPVETEILEAKDFLRLAREQPSIIKHTRPVASSLGSRSLGGIEVTYSRPIYKNSFLKASLKR